MGGAALLWFARDSSEPRDTGHVPSAAPPGGQQTPGPTRPAATVDPERPAEPALQVGVGGGRRNGGGGGDGMGRRRGRDAERGHGRGMGNGEGTGEGGTDELGIVIKGKPVESWTREQLDQIPASAKISTEGGEAEGWSLRDLAPAIGGAGARIAALRSAEGESLILTAADWNDATRIPVIRYNRRGVLKFDWIDAKTNQQLPGGLRDIEQLTLDR